jgi:hypothetical protein
MHCHPRRESVEEVPYLVYCGGIGRTGFMECVTLMEDRMPLAYQLPHILCFRYLFPKLLYLSVPKILTTQIPETPKYGKQG